MTGAYGLLRRYAPRKDGYVKNIFPLSGEVPEHLCEGEGGILRHAGAGKVVVSI